MKIGMFTDTWLPTRDGIVTSIIKYRESLEKDGHEVFIFAPGEKNSEDYDNKIFLYKSKPFRQYPSYRLASKPTNRTCDLMLENDIASANKKYLTIYFECN